MLTLTGVLLITLAALWLPLGATLNYHGVGVGRWWVLTIALVGGAFYGWWNGHLEVLQQVAPLAVLLVLAGYLAVGLVWSGLELALLLRDEARRYRLAWDSFLSRETVVFTKDGDPTRLVAGRYVVKGPDGDRFAKPPGILGHFKVTQQKLAVQRVLELARTESGQGFDGRAYADHLLNDFVTRTQRSYPRVIDLQITPALDIQPKLNQDGLTAHLIAWVTLWPTYVASLLGGRVVTEVIQSVSTRVHQLTRTLIDRTFNGIFSRW